MILIQKSIYDVLAGMYAATAGATIYSVFDYITFEETLHNHLVASNDTSKIVSQDVNLKFALQGNAKLAIIIFSCG